MTTILATLVFCVSASSSLWADAGKRTAEFLKLGAGARAAALGGAYSALADDPSALYWNPASLVQMPERRLATFTHNVYIESTFFDYLAYAQQMGEQATLGASLQYFSAGKITQTDETGSDVGNFTPNDMALSIGYARKELFWGFSLGGGAKFIQSKIIDSAQGFALDLGLLSPSLLNGKLRLALAASNLGGKMKFVTDKESLPALVRLGSAYRIKDNWSATLDLEAPSEDKISAAIATEYGYSLSNGRSLTGRFGLNTKTFGEVGGLTGFAFGVGFRDSWFSTDYAMAPLGDLGLTHRLSFSVRF